MRELDTRKLAVEMNSPLSAAIEARKNQDPFLRDFGRSKYEDTLNERDNTTLTQNYLNQQFKHRGNLFKEELKNY